MQFFLVLLIFLVGCSTQNQKKPGSEASVFSSQEDPFLWLEDVEGERALKWVSNENTASTQRLESDKRFRPIEKQVLSILESNDRIPYVWQGRGWFYNFWQDQKNTRGVWRRTLGAEYQKLSPRWNVLLDLDKLARKEKENWVWKGESGLSDDSRFLISLSRGGKDAVVVREFDATKRQFVQGGFEVPEAKTDVDWWDKNRLLIATDFGPGSLTHSGYPRVLKVWNRGEALDKATTVLEGDVSDVSVSPMVIETPEGPVAFLVRSLTFYTSQYFLLGPDLKAVRLNLPEDVGLEGVWKGLSFWRLRSQWVVAGRSFPEGSVVSIELGQLLTGDLKPTLVFEPTETSSFGHLAFSRSAIHLMYNENVDSRIVRLTLQAGKWERSPVLLPDLGVIGLLASNPWSDLLMASYESYTRPNTLYLLNEKNPPLKIKALPEKFKAEGVFVEQRFATSKDGTRIPYFIVGPKEARNLPTVLSAYGGFEISSLPSYMPAWGQQWLEKGFVFVEANIRGGGEFGPRWHKAALKENRQKAFDDLIAVAEDLIHAGVTSPQKLAIEGGSNGGLLVGAAFTQRPDLFRAVLCKVPLLDMLRFHKLLAGASWIGEYGNPDDNGERKALEAYSPYQNLKEGVQYPEVFFITSTKDDRVHPGHARKMVAKMKALGQPVLYFENTEGGHAASANLKQRAKMQALQFTYLLQKLN